MLRELDAAERAYRMVDGIYRLHRDLFEIENLLARTARLEVSLARVSTNGRMGAVVAGILAIVPILIALGDIKWGSVPALAVYVLAAGVVILWLFQAASAGKVDEQLSILEGYASHDVLEERVDFVLEETNAWVTRHQMVEGIIRQLAIAEAEAVDSDVKSRLDARRIRYEEIKTSCEDYIEYMIDTSARLVAAEKRSKHDHDELLDWAEPVRSSVGTNNMADERGTA